METKTPYFFHSKASQRRRRNFIQGVKDQQQNWVEEISDIVGVATEYFESIFSSGRCDQMDECLNTIQHKMMEDMQEVLSNEYCAEEIKAALF